MGRVSGSTAYIWHTGIRIYLAIRIVFCIPGRNSREILGETDQVYFASLLFFGALYAGLKGLDMAGSEGIPLLQAFWYFLWRHWLLGDFHGYFILIIFQFYALFLLFQKHAKNSLHALY